MRAMIVNAPSRRRGGAIGVTGVGEMVLGDFVRASVASTGRSDNRGYCRGSPSVCAERTNRPPGASSMAAERRLRFASPDDIAQSRRWPTRRESRWSIRRRRPTRCLCRTTSRNAVGWHRPRRPRYRNPLPCRQHSDGPARRMGARRGERLPHPRYRSRTPARKAASARLGAPASRGRSRAQPHRAATSVREGSLDTDARRFEASRVAARRAGRHNVPSPRLRYASCCAALSPANCDKSIALALRKPAITSLAR